MTRATSGDGAVLVTGADGFIGSRLVERLWRAGGEVRAICGTEPGAVNLPPGVKGVATDIRRLDPQLRLGRGIRCVVHLAGPPSVRESFARPEHYHGVHVDGTSAVVELCKAQGIGRLVYVSSAEVYGPARTATVPEDHPLAPQSPYGEAKAGAEAVVAAFARSPGVTVTVLRPFSVYGAGMSAASVLATIVARAMEASRVELDDLRPVRDYCYVDDVTRAIELGVARAPAGPRVFNVGSGRGVSVLELARTTLRVMERRLPVVQRCGADDRRSADVTRLVAATERARVELGWFASTTLERGLVATLDGMRSASCSDT